MKGRDVAGAGASAGDSGIRWHRMGRREEVAMHPLGLSHPSVSQP